MLLRAKKEKDYSALTLKLQISMVASELMVDSFKLLLITHIPYTYSRRPTGP